MITLNLLESNWWDRFYEINVLKSVNKLYFGQNIKKKCKFSLFIFNLFTFQIPKILRPNFPLSNSEKPVPFSRIKVLLMQKKFRCTFFRSEEVFF